MHFSGSRPRPLMAAVLLAGVLLAACAGPTLPDAGRAGSSGASTSAAPSAAGTAAGTSSAAQRESSAGAAGGAMGEPDPRGAADSGTAADSTAAESTAAESAGADASAARSGSSTSGQTTPATGRRAGRFTVNFAGDVNFADRTADRLAADPATAFGVAAPGLAAADLTMVNLETAITTGGTPEPKSFTFRAPPSALTALRDAGVDVASMANNHGADYGDVGLRDSIAAIAGSGFPVIGIGADHAAATAPFRARINGVAVTIFAATAIHDHTLAAWTAGAKTPGVASAFDPALIANVRAAAAAGDTVIVFLHWGTEYVSCPDDDQLQLADALTGAGAAAVVGGHAHVLQGAGWRPDGGYVAYGLGNYLWWRSFGNEQDDNGVLTLTFDGRKVSDARFAPSHLSDTGVPVPATGADAERIDAQWQAVRSCAGLSDSPPR